MTLSTKQNTTMDEKDLTKILKNKKKKTRYFNRKIEK